MWILGGNVYVVDHFEALDVEIRNGRIAGLFPRGSAPETEGRVVDAAGKKVLPGLTDIHFHGAMGFDVCDGDLRSMEAIARYEASVGVTQILPATMTYPEERLAPVFEAARAYGNTAAHLVGIHMEGPYISREKIGAQNPAYVMAPDIGMTERLDARSGGLLKIISVAPELPGAMDYARALGGRYILSVAHTAADYDTAKAAYAAGFSHLTHMFNAMPGIGHRAPGVIPAAWESGATCELIADGIHIHPAVVRLAFSLFSPDRLILVSDSMRATGLSDGAYDLGGQQVRVVGRRANLVEGGAIAGSATNLWDCMREAVRMGIPEERAIFAASTAPAQRIGIAPTCGVIAEGACANLAIAGEDLTLEGVLLKGEWQ